VAHVLGGQAAVALEDVQRAANRRPVLRAATRQARVVANDPVALAAVPSQAQVVVLERQNRPAAPTVGQETLPIPNAAQKPRPSVVRPTRPLAPTRRPRRRFALSMTGRRESASRRRNVRNPWSLDRGVPVAT